MGQLFDLFFGTDNKNKGAKFMSPSKRRKLFSHRHKGFTITGKQSGKIALDQVFRHTTLLAITGEGKTAGVLIPSLLNFTGETSAVVMDTGEALATCREHLETKGFEIKVIDLENPTNPESLQFNPLELMQTQRDVTRVAQTLIDSSYKENTSDSFWQFGARDILSLIIKRLCFSEQDQYEKNLQSVLYVIREIEVVMGAQGKSPLKQKMLDEFFIEGASKEDVQQYRAILNSQSPKTVASILATAKNALGAFNNPDLQHASHHNTIDFHQLRKKPTILFVIFKETNIEFYDFYLSLFFQSLFSVLMEERLGNETYKPVMVFMEEAGMYKVDKLPKLISVLRKKQVGLILIFQELQQLEDTYGKNYRTILSNCATKLILGGITDTKTLDWLEKMVGEKITELENGHLRREPLLSGNQIRQLDKQILATYGKEDPVLLPYTLYYKNKRLKRRCGIL